MDFVSLTHSIWPFRTVMHLWVIGCDCSRSPQPEAVPRPARQRARPIILAIIVAPAHTVRAASATIAPSARCLWCIWAHPRGAVRAGQTPSMPDSQWPSPFALVLAFSGKR